MKNDYMNNHIIILLSIMPLLPITTSFKLTIFSSVILMIVLLMTLFSMKFISRVVKNIYYEGFVVLISIFYLSVIRIILISIGFNFINQLGTYFSIIGVNSIILFLYESRVQKRLYLKEDIKIILLSLLFISIFSLFRELIGRGYVDFSIRVGEDFSHFAFSIKELFKIFSNNNHPFGLSFLILPSGGLILLGFCVALYRYIKSKIKR